MRTYRVTCDEAGCDANTEQDIGSRSTWQEVEVKPFNRSWGAIVLLQFCPDHAIRVDADRIPPGDRLPCPWLVP